MRGAAVKPEESSRIRKPLWVALILLGSAVFSVLFILLDTSYFRFADARFPSVGGSAWLATLWGVVSRTHVLLLIVPFIIWRPHLFGFQIGKTRQYWKMLLIMLFLNCGMVAVYLWLTIGTTPYSNDIWLVTEVIVVPFVEETFWRGLVYTALQFLFIRLFSEHSGKLMAVWISGILFGLLHFNNLFAGMPLSFVAIQALNATTWGVVYGYARSKTESIYPPMLLHAAMNLTIILF